MDNLLNRKKVAVGLCILTLLYCLNYSLPVLAKEKNEPSLHASSAVLMDGDSGRILYGKNENEVRAMASTTKIMTLILALEFGNLDGVVTVSPYAAKMPEVSLDVRAGEQYQVLDLLYSMMLESHNDSAVCVAEYIGGSVTQFSEMMNQKAKEIGLASTYFITPNGLDSEDENGMHSTTAKELALLLRYCTMFSPERELFKKICTTAEYHFTDQSGKRQFSVYNHNKLLTMMDGVVAGKTGFTSKAGYCYVVHVTIQDKNYIIALLGCGWPYHKNYKWEDVKALIAYGKQYEQKNLLELSDVPDSVHVVEGKNESVVPLYWKSSEMVLLREDENVDYRIVLPAELVAPVKKDQKVGYIEFRIDGEVYRNIDIYALCSIDAVDYAYYFRMLLESFLFGYNKSYYYAYNTVLQGGI